MRELRVEWIDSASCTGWLERPDVENFNPVKIVSCGFMVNETENSLVLAQSCGDDPEQYENLISIPKGCIKRIEYIGDSFVEVRLKQIMELKQKLGEFSVDLYYNDCDHENPYTAKISSAINALPEYHGRGRNFSEALDFVEDFLKKHLAIK